MALKTQEELFKKQILRLTGLRRIEIKLFATWNMECEVVAFLQQIYRDSDYHKVLFVRAQITPSITGLNWILCWWASYSLRLTPPKDTKVIKLRQKNLCSYLDLTASVEPEQLPGWDLKTFMYF